jgi:hypothetical protein
MVYRSIEDVNVEERAMAWCRLSVVIRVKARLIERQNDRLDDVIRSGQKLCEVLQARNDARAADTANCRARLERFKRINDPTHEDILSYIAEAEANARHYAEIRAALPTF